MMKKKKCQCPSEIEEMDISPRTRQLRMTISLLSTVSSIISILLWGELLRAQRRQMSRQEFNSILILLSNDVLRIVLGVTERFTSRYLLLRVLPFTIQFLLARRRVTRIATSPWMIRIFYFNLAIDLIMTLLLGMVFYDSRIFFLTGLELLIA